MKKLLLIASKISGDQSDAVAEMRALLDEHKISHDVVRIAQPPEAVKIIKQRAKDYEDLAVYGGDGTVVMTIKALADTKKRLLVLPGGTANTIAKELKLDADPLAVLKQYSSGVCRPYYYDLASANGRLFALDMHTGWWTEAIKNTPRDLKKHFSKLAYGITAIRLLPKAQKRRYELEIDGRLRRVSGYTLLVANRGSQSFLGVNLFPRAHRSGMLQVALVRSLFFPRLLVWLLGRTVSSRNIGGAIMTFRAHEILITKADEKFLFDDHGEELNLPITIKGGFKHATLLVPPEPWARRKNYLVLLLIRLKERLRNSWQGQPAYRYTQFAPGLYVGGAYRQKAYEQFRKWGVTGVVNMRSTAPEEPPRGFEVLHLKTRDWSAPPIEILLKGIDFIDKHRQAGGGVYIHCRQGEGRGPTMAAAYLISQGLTVEEAIRQLQVGRPQARPNHAQRQRLKELRDQLTKSSFKNK